MSMSPFGNDLVTLIEAAGVGVLGVDVFESLKATVPQLPLGSATVHIVTTGGTSPDHTQNSVLVPAYIQPGAQFTIRAQDPADAERKARLVYDAVHIRNQFVNSGWYLWIKPLQEPYELTMLDTDDSRYIFNVICKRRYYAQKA